MKPRFGSALMGLAAFILGATALKAEDPGLTAALKLRGLLSSSASDQGLSNNILGNNLELGEGFGLELGFAAGAGRFTAELGYQVLAGDAFMGNVSGMPNNGSIPIDPAASIESRKNKLEGLTLRLGYEAPLSGKLAWRAGLQFGGNKFTHQVLGNINGSVTVNNVTSSFSDSYVYVGSKTGSMPSPFGGLTYNFDQDNALEFGVLLLQYSSLNYQHVANTSNQFDTVPSKNRILPNLEVAYVFRF